MTWLDIVMVGKNVQRLGIIGVKKIHSGKTNISHGRCNITYENGSGRKRHGGGIGDLPLRETAESADV